MKKEIYRYLITMFLLCLGLFNPCKSLNLKAAETPVFEVKEWNRNGSLSSEEGTIVYDKIIVTSDTGDEDFVWEDQYINVRLGDGETTVVTAVSDDSNVVIVKGLYKISSSLYSFTIIPMGIGKTQITLTDQYGQSIKKDVEIRQSYMDGIKEYFSKTLSVPYGRQQISFEGPINAKVSATVGEKVIEVNTPDSLRYYIKNTSMMKAGTKILVTFTRSGYSFTKTIMINKAANPLYVKGKTVKIKYKSLKKKDILIKRTTALTVTKAKGKVTYKLVSMKKTKYKKYFKINSKTGKIRVKKGLKKGTYTLKIKVSAAGGSNYKALSKTAVAKIRVK